MTFKGALRYVRLLLKADSKAWSHLPYLVSMASRGVDLRGLHGPEAVGLPPDRANACTDSGGPDLHKLLKTLPISASDAVLDFGCGKGGAMLTLARYSFVRVDGVELSADLVQIARQNLSRLGVKNATVFHSDAAEFRDLDTYTYFYMYNPFPPVIVAAVLENVALSADRRSRPITLIYKNPVCHDLLTSAGFKVIKETRQIHPDYPAFRVYTLSSRPTSGFEASLSASQTVGC